MHPDWPQLHQIFFFSVQGGPDTPIDFVSVSYTHLTLPTNREV